ncbi:acyl-CoA dehydrogenase, partial [Salmonella enterica subsp. enterica serovar Anatum]|nr:acyl-CoA dehydrogenase [Salmonella enterica subsp. enterica serovar Anatum]
IATVVLLGALFYHRVSLFLSSLILLAWTAALGVAGLWSIWLLAEEVLARWEQIKTEERAQKAQHSALDDIPRSLPALMRAQKIQK